MSIGKTHCCVSGPMMSRASLAQAPYADKSIQGDRRPGRRGHLLGYWQPLQATNCVVTVPVEEIV